MNICRKCRRPIARHTFEQARKCLSAGPVDVSSKFGDVIFEAGDFKIYLDGFTVYCWDNEDLVLTDTVLNLPVKFTMSKQSLHFVGKKGDIGISLGEVFK